MQLEVIGQGQYQTKQKMVYHTLRQAIMHCQLQPGQRLVIEDIAHQLHVSPIPVREALQLARETGVRVHLNQLESEGRLKTYAGKSKRPNVAKQQRDVEHAKQRTTIINQGKKLEADQRRAEIRMQENPPTGQWSVPPRYELVGTAKDAAR